MYKNTKSANAKVRRIAKIAAHLFNKKGYGQATTKEIAEACHISVGTLYYYIKSKEDFIRIFSDLLSDDITMLARKIHAQMRDISPEEALRKTVRERLRLMDEMRDIVSFWYRISRYLKGEQLKGIADAELQVVALIKEILELGCKKGDFCVKDTYVAAYNIHMITHSWVLKSWAFRGNYTVERYTQICEDMAVSLVHGYRNWKDQ
jgi:TetR/AcrR family transcriptional regulator, cholesterol catabolism regulator